jgi:hypothetical protein
MKNQEQHMKNRGRVILVLGGMMSLIGLAGLGGIFAWYQSDPNLHFGNGIGLEALFIATLIVAIGMAVIHAGIEQQQTGQQNKNVALVAAVFLVALIISLLRAGIA